MTSCIVFKISLELINIGHLPVGFLDYDEMYEVMYIVREQRETNKIRAKELHV